MAKRGTSIYTKLPGVKNVLKKYGIEPYGDLQMFLADEIVYYCIDYVPYLSGQLANSPIDRGIIEDGGQTVRWSAKGDNGYNYAGYQYYLQDWYPEPNYSNQNGLRGSHWDKRMMADHRQDIINDLQKKIDKGEKK